MSLCVWSVTLCTGADNPCFPHNENSGSRDGGRVVIIGTTSDRIPEAVRSWLCKGEVKRVGELLPQDSRRGALDGKNGLSSWRCRKGIDTPSQSRHCVCWCDTTGMGFRKWCRGQFRATVAFERLRAQLLCHCFGITRTPVMSYCAPCPVASG
ncbi:hypothetical protein BGY98DRAFT_287321 [Russula aff. rugulosa BPL654]|nr:hypothetical protein BGY98DRAFT_287321 [Russula aff. rugulosa BPL654]